MTRHRGRPPLPHPTRDWLTITLWFVGGAILGATIGLRTALRHSRSDNVHVSGFAVGALAGGLLAVWLGRLEARSMWRR